MKPDDFEAQLRRQSLRPIPVEWRDGILQKAQAASDARLSSWWRELLWPCPQAWAGVAAAWCLVLGLHLASRTPEGKTSGAIAEPSPQMLMALREQRQMLAELIEPLPTLPPRRREPSRLKPRSDRRPDLLAA